MSKLGDLIVRLKLQYEDYKKGLKNAANETNSFGGALGKLKGVGLAVWGAIGASAVAFAQQLVNNSQTIGDAWARVTSQMRAGWDVFVQSVAAWNWDNFIGRIKEATVAAKAFTNAMDAEFEVSNSIKLQKAAMAEELAELEILARDQTKSYEDRAKAAQTYLDKVKPLYDQELTLAKNLEDAQLGKFLAGSGLEDTEKVREDLRKFLVDVGKIPTLIDDLSAKSKAQKTIEKGANFLGSNYGKISKAYDVRNELTSKLKDIQAEYETDLVALFRVYNDMRADKDTIPLVEAMIRAGEAAGAFNRETKRIQSLLNSSTAHIQPEKIAEDAKAIERIVLDLPKVSEAFNQSVTMMAIPDIIPDDWLERNREKIDAAVAEAMRLQGITDEINMAFQNAVVGSLSGATQALTDCIAGIEGADASQVLAALLEPFASTMTQMGEMLIIEGAGIKAFKESLKSLNPAVAIGAGMALLALGAALSSGLRKLGSSAGSAGASASSSSVSTSVANQDFQTEQTIYVKGKISGADILIAGDNQKNKWRK